MTETKREYKLAADPIPPRGHEPKRRELVQVTSDGHREVILIVPESCAVDVLETVRRAYRDGREDRGSEDEPIRAGARVRLISPPGTKISYGAVGVAEGPPDASGLFWAQFPAGSMHTRVSEVEILRENGEQP